MSDKERWDTAQAEFGELFEEMRGISGRLRALSEAEPNHGYASVGRAYDRMVRKSEILTQDVYIMVRMGPAAGSQRIGG